MTKLVVLKFYGSLASGFLVNSDIGQEGRSVDRGRSGSLPPGAQLNHYLNTWQQLYNQLGNNLRIKPQQIIYDGSINPLKQLAKSAKQLEQAFLQWLDSGEFSPIDRHLREELNRDEPARVLICSDRPAIHQLPWCCWDLVENYPHLEIAVSNLNFDRMPIAPKPPRQQKVRILAILGDGEGINLEADRTFLHTLEAGYVKFLTEPTIPELYDCLWQETWDIVFFAGHSKTLDRQGILYLNSQDQLTIEQLRYGFKQAIASGLQLAIFNSCDGLGLAEELGQLSLPQSIVMRSPIPDEMAQQFVKCFLEAYAGGNSLYLAMRKAREQLQSREKQFPCASWLPVIYQNPAIIPPQWSDFAPSLDPPPLDSPPLEPKSSSSKPQFASGISIAAVVTAFIWLMQLFGWLESAELDAYDRLLLWRYNPPIDERVLVVTIDDRDLAYQGEQGWALNMRGSLADPALNQLVQKLNSAPVKAIASDIIHDFPFDRELAATIAQNDNFVAICRIKNLPKLISIAPPDQLEPQQLGFSNWAIDNDDTIRRQILGMSPDNLCQSSISLSLRLALKYLGDVPTKFNSQSPLEIAQIPFPRLKSSSGGYSLAETETDGYQILLNYRRGIPRTIPLREILTKSQVEIDQLVKDKLILIGVDGYKQDLHDTPYSIGKQADPFPGVLIHAMMTSQIIDVIQGKQKLLHWASEPLEILWIAVWAMIGSSIFLLQKRSPIKITVLLAASLGILFCCCWLLLLNGIWIVAIAPALGIILSATTALAYSRRRSTGN
ncbi:MAG: CHASE2 domain-containing protein [Cyanobacteria bacterium J06621_12]